MNELRHYQVDARVRAEACLAGLSLSGTALSSDFRPNGPEGDPVDIPDGGFRSSLVVMPTGTGKTQLFGATVNDWVLRGARALVLAHRNELIIQARNRLEQMTGKFCDIEKAKRKAYSSPIVVGSMQSVRQKRRLQRLGRRGFDLIVIDEAHRSLSDSYLTILDWFDEAKVLGVTATPDRGDGKALGRVFQSEAYRLEIQEAIRLGWLVPVEGERVYLDEIDISHIRSRMGDLPDGELDDVMLKAAAGVAKKSCSIIGPEDGQGIAFFPGVRSAAAACEWFNKYRPGSAEFVCGETDDDERDEIFRRFKAGKFQFLVNVDIATEGFDHPPATWCIMARLTESRSRYAQCVGRVTRPLWEALKGLPLDEASAELRRAAIASSAKPCCKILDFNGNSGKHTLVGPEDVLGGDYTEAEIKEAKRAAEKNGEMADVANRLSAAREKLRREAEERDAALKARREKFDPFNVNYGTTQQSGPPPRDPATQPQKDFLRVLGAKFDPNISKKQATALINKLKADFKDESKRPATDKMKWRLRQYTSIPADLKFAQARQALDYIAEQRVQRLRPDKAMLDRILAGKVNI